MVAERIGAMAADFDPTWAQSFFFLMRESLRQSCEDDDTMRDGIFFWGGSRRAFTPSERL